MKRNKKLIKEILLTLRDTEKPQDVWLDMTIKKYHPEVIEKHFKLLHETGLIDAINASYVNGAKFIPQRLTKEGHDYLEFISKSMGQKILEKFLGVSGKMIWLFVGGFTGATGTIVANQFFHICK